MSNIKNILIIGVVLILAGGVFLLFGMNEKVEAPVAETPTPKTSTEEESVVCTMDAKICPDGSYVGRIGPNCEFAACPSDKTSGVVKEFTVEGKNFSFTPSLITVKKGDKVKITFKNSEGFHDFVIEEFGVATKQGKSPVTEVVEFTADKVGSFEYYCSVGSHRSMGMKGTLKVE